MRHPCLAWRILDAVGHEEIIIGGLPTVHDIMGMNMAALGASGIQVLAELPAGTELIRRRSGAEHQATIRDGRQQLCRRC